MICSIIWMVLCELWLSRRFNGNNSYTLLWRLRDRTCPNIMLKSLQRLVSFFFQHISWICSTRSNYLGIGTRRWILIRTMRLLILLNPSWSTWRKNTTPNINECPPLYLKTIHMAISSPQQTLLDWVNRLLIHIGFQVMMQNSEDLKVWLKRHPNEVIVQHSYWQPPDSIWILRHNHQRTGGKLIQMLMIITPTPGRLEIHFGYWTSPTGGASKGKRTQSTPIAPMWLTTYYLLYHMVLDWRPDFPFSKTLLVGDGLKPLARYFGKMS